MSDRNVSMGKPRPVSDHANMQLETATLMWQVMLMMPKSGKATINDWHAACEVVVAELMGDAYGAHNCLDHRKKTP